MATDANDRDLNDEEQSLLEEFEHHDKELEDIALIIVQELEKVKGKTENIE